MNIFKKINHLLVIYLVSFFTAFCSLIYELQYSQLLSVLYGNSVLRYSLTIGLYLFSLGLGSLSYRVFKKFKSGNVLWFSQILLAVIGPLGVVGVIWMDSQLFEMYQLYSEKYAIILAHFPIIITGMLVGIQIPLLSMLGNKIKKREDMFVEVLGIDYFGSLIGSVSYGLFLYSTLGLIKTAILVGVLNALLAASCTVFIVERRMKYFSMFLIALFILLGVKGAVIEKNVMDTYMLTSVYKEKAVDNSNFLLRLAKQGIIPGIFSNQLFSVNMNNYFNTPYQEVIEYTIEKNGVTDKCLKLSRHTNMCDSWANSYHDALANIPMAFFAKRDEPYNVLLLGGGSLLPVKNLLKYNINLDQVDIDQKFIDYAKTDQYFVKYHQNAWQDPRLHIYFEDAYTFLRHNNKKYDLVVMSLPGFGSDKLIQLGSVEFFTFLNQALADEGLVVTWEYGDIGDKNGDSTALNTNPQHLKVLFDDIKEGGFNSYLIFNSYVDVADQQKKAPSDIFYLLQKKNTERQIDLESNDYVKSMKSYYSNMSWHSLDDVDFSNVRSSHIFSPNYGIMTDL